jgi:hypothetical protein
MPINYAAAPTPYGGGGSGGADQQRNAITQALMRVANPPPNTGMPQQRSGYGGMRPAMPPPNNLGSTMPNPQDPLAAAGAMPPPGGQAPGGLMQQAGVAPSPLPQTPPQMMPPTPASGMPQGPQPNVPQALGQGPLVQPPNANLLPPGLNPGNY